MQVCGFLVWVSVDAVDVCLFSLSHSVLIWSLAGESWGWSSPLTLSHHQALATVRSPTPSLHSLPGEWKGATTWLRVTPVPVSVKPIVITSWCLSTPPPPLPSAPHPLTPSHSPGPFFSSSLSLSAAKPVAPCGSAFSPDSSGRCLTVSQVEWCF